MARQKNDGRGRMGGRAKGTPNKATATLREWVSSLIDGNRRQIERDLMALEPKDRLQMIEKLMQYVLPKQQTATVAIDKLTDEQLQAVVDELTKDIPTDPEELTN